MRLLFRDRPLEGALVVALPKDAPEHKLEARTDSSGRVVLELGAGEPGS